MKALTFPTDFRWTASSPLITAKPSAGEDWHSIKDPSAVWYNSHWHVFCTVRGQKRSHAVVCLSFKEWSEAAGAEQRVLGCHEGYFCAPQVFYFAPQKKWYLVCQASDKRWSPEYQAAYSTTTDISDPGSWSPLKPLGAKQAEGKSGLDFWIICDAEKAHLFFTTLDGRMWREETALRDFPSGWSEPVLAIRGDIFEASHTYRLKGSSAFLTLVEAQNGFGWRYFKAYLAGRLEGPWIPLAASKDTSFASLRNVRWSDGQWSDAVSHGELFRAGYDERLEVDPANLQFLFQGVTDRERQGKNYGQIPWRLGILKPER